MILSRRSFRYCSTDWPEKSEKFISQSIEKLFDGITLKDTDEYTIILLAEPIAHQVEERKARLYELYTALAPFASWQTNYTYTVSDIAGSQASVSANAGINKSRYAGEHHDHTEGINKPSKEKNTARITGAALSGVSIIAGLVPGVGSIARTLLEVAGAGAGFLSGMMGDETISDTHGTNSGSNSGFNFGMNFLRSSSMNMAAGKNEGITNTYINCDTISTIFHSIHIFSNQP